MSAAGLGTELKNRRLGQTTPLAARRGCHATVVASGMHAHADSDAGRAPSLGGDQKADPAFFDDGKLGAGDAVVGQVEDGGGSIGRWKGISINARGSPRLKRSHTDAGLTSTNSPAKETRR